MRRHVCCRSVRGTEATRPCRTSRGTGKGDGERKVRRGPVQTRYETGFYQIISCHTDDDAAELTPGLAFPVNAAANQTRLQSPPFSSFRPATLTRTARLSVHSLSLSLFLYLSVSLPPLFIFLRPHHLSLCPSFFVSLHLLPTIPLIPFNPLPLFPPFSRLPRRFVPWSFRFLSVRMEGSKNSTRRRIAAGGLGICMRGIYNWAMFILWWNYHRCNYGEPRKR